MACGRGDKGHHLHPSENTHQQGPACRHVHCSSSRSLPCRNPLLRGGEYPMVQGKPVYDRFGRGLAGPNWRSHWPPSHSSPTLGVSPVEILDPSRVVVAGGPGARGAGGRVERRGFGLVWFGSRPVPDALAHGQHSPLCRHDWARRIAVVRSQGLPDC